MSILLSGCLWSIGLLAFVLSAPAPAAAAASSCPTNGLTLTDGQWLLVEGDCSVDGNITLSGTSLLIVTDSHFVLRGNLIGRDGAIVYVQRSEFVVDNRFNAEWFIDMSGKALTWFSETVFRSNQGSDRSFFMGYYGREQSTLRVTNSSLSTANNWLIARISNQAKAYVSGGSDFPSEVVMADQSTARLDTGTRTSLWIPFGTGSKATLVLPDQTAGPYSFSFGRTTPNVVGIGYQVLILDSIVRLGLSSSPGSNLLVVGRGTGYSSSGSGEVSIGYLMPGVLSPELITGLRPGYQAYTRLTHQGRNLILYNVAVDPLGWNVYVSGSPALVTVRDSILNEVAAFPGGKVEVQNCILQWAVLGSTGAGSTLVVRDSQIYSQVIHSTGDGRIDLYDSVVHGSPFEALDDSTIEVHGGLLEPNGEPNPCNLNTGLTTSGVPLCNPFVAPGAIPTTSVGGNGQVLIDGVPPSGIADLHLVGYTEPDVVPVGGLFTYHLQTGNAGPDPATGVVVTVRTPAQAIIQSASPSCSLSGRDLVCTIGDLAVYQPSDWITVTYKASLALTPAVGEGTVAGDQIDPDPSNHTLELTNTIQ